MTFGKCIGSILLFGLLLAGVLSTISCTGSAPLAPSFAKTCYTTLVGYIPDTPPQTLCVGNYCSTIPGHPGDPGTAVTHCY